MAFAIYETLGSLTGFTTAVNELHVAELYANVVPDGQQRLLCTSFDDNICCYCCDFVLIMLLLLLSLALV